MAETPKQIAFAGMAVVAKALASPPRLELLELLAQCERTVEALAKATSLSVANASQHLQVLKRAGLVATKKEGTYVHYRLADSRVADVHVALRGLAEASVRGVKEAAESDLDQVDRQDLLKRAERGELIVVDVRPAEEYGAAHLPHAVSIPLDELAERLAELPEDREIVAYCRGPYCAWAPKAAALLRDRGFDASSLPDGVVDWRLQGLPLEVA